MEISRREFLALSGTAAVVGADYLARQSSSGYRLFREAFGQESRPITLDFDPAVLVRKAVYREKAWRAAVDALREKYKDINVIVVEGEIEEALPALREQRPTHVNYPERPEVLAVPELVPATDIAGIERGRQLGEASGVGRFYRLLNEVGNGTRASIGGIITGLTPEDALRLAQAEPFDIDYSMCISLPLLEVLRGGVKFEDSKRQHPDGQFITRHEKGNGEIVESRARFAGPEFLERVNSGEVDLIVTSAHASYADWNPGYNYKDDRFLIGEQGNIWVLDHEDDHIKGRVDSTNPKAYIGVGNCQMGRIKDARRSMALAWMHSGGVRQHFGYTVDTWYGFAGWGIIDHLVSGNPTLFEAMQMNTLALQHYMRLVGEHTRANGFVTGKDLIGLGYDQNTFVGYGDACLPVRIRRDPSAVPFLNVDGEVIRGKEGDVYRLVVRVNKDGQVGMAPPVALLPRLTPRNIRASEGLKYEFGDRHVVLSVGHNIVRGEVDAVVNGQRKRLPVSVLEPRNLRAGQTLELEFSN